MSYLSNDNSSFIIGGAGRSGKTTLARVLNNQSKEIAGFPLDTLFTIYYYRKFIWFNDNKKKKVLHDFIYRYRFTNGDRTGYKNPYQCLNKSIDFSKLKIPNTVSNPLSLIGWYLNIYADTFEKKTWASFDLFPEFIFKDIIKSIPNTKMIVMRRCPYEVLASTLYWRGAYPTKISRANNIKQTLYMWLLSYKLTFYLMEKYPYHIQSFNFNELTSGNEKEIEKLSQFTNIKSSEIKESFAYSPYYSWDSVNGFKMEDGSWKNDLFTRDELNTIENILYINRQIWNPGYRVSKNYRPSLSLIYTKCFINISYKKPLIGQYLGELIHRREKLIGRKINLLKQFIKDNFMPYKETKYEKNMFKQ